MISTDRKLLSDGLEMNQNDARAAALDQITALAKQYQLSVDEIAARLVKDTPRTAKGGSAIIVRLLTYIGGLFIFSGLIAYVSLIWDELNSPARVIITFGPGLIALIMGMAVLKDERYARASTPCFLIAALLQPAGLFVYLSEYFSGDDALMAAMVVFGPLAVQMGLLFWKTRRTSLLFFALTYGFAFFWAAMDKIGMDEDFVSFVLGLSGLLVTHAINRTPYRAFAPFTYFIFALCMAGGAFAILKDWQPLDFALIGLAAFMIYASVMAQSRSFLVASIIAMLGYLGYYTDEYFADLIGWPIALIVMGFVMVGLSAYAVKLSQKISAPSKT